jgi:hypothetical protein
VAKKYETCGRERRRMGEKEREKGEIEDLHAIGSITKLLPHHFPGDTKLTQHNGYLRS